MEHLHLMDFAVLYFLYFKLYGKYFYLLLYGKRAKKIPSTMGDRANLPYFEFCPKHAFIIKWIGSDFPLNYTKQNKFTLR